MFRVQQFHNVSVVDADGELSRHNVHVLEDVLNHLSSTDRRNVVLNLEGLKHLDYRLVQRIADRIIQFQCDGGDLKMANVSAYVRQIMEAMGFETEVYTSVEEALLSFLQGEGPRERH